MKIIDDFKKFTEIGKTITLNFFASSDVSNVTKEILIATRMVRDASFEKTSAIDATNLYTNDKNNIKVSLEFTDLQDKAVYHINSLNNQEYAKIHVDRISKTVDFSMNDIKVKEPYQIKELLKTLEIDSIFSNIKSACNKDKLQQRKQKESKNINTYLESKMNKKDIPESSQQYFTQYQSVYFNLIGLAYDKMIKQHQLSLSEDRFEGYNEKTKKNFVLNKTGKLPHLLFSDTNVSVYFQKKESFKNRSNFEIIVKVSPKGNKADELPFLNILNNFNENDIIKNSLAKDDMPQFYFDNKSIQIKFDEHKSKLLDSVNLPKILLNLTSTLTEENIQLDQLLAEKQNQLSISLLSDKKQIQERIAQLQETKIKSGMVKP